MRAIIALTALFAGLALLGSAQADEYAITIDNFAFSPDEITIVAGDSVVWTNNDNGAHTVEDDEGEFGSGNLDSGASFSFTFEAAGNYSYHCGYHSSMTGVINVEEAEGDPVDTDEDGLTDEEEHDLGTDPGNPDSDADGLTDGDEVHVYETDPNNHDSDWDGLGDGEEVHDYGTEPLLWDSD